MKIEIEIPEWVAATLRNWQLPEELCGTSIEERAVYGLAQQADYICIISELLEKNRATKH